MNAILKLQNISKFYKQGLEKIEVIKNSSFEIKKGEKVAFVGPSGCGKTTLLQICGLLDSPNSGEIYIDGQKTNNLSDFKKTEIRKNKLGFIYQFHHLLPEFSAVENVMLPLFIRGVSHKEGLEKAKKVLKDLGLEKRLEHRPGELSGGEQQRVALARAVIGNPLLILADEPTGNLDPENAEMVFKLLLDVIKEYGSSLLMVTHNIEFAKKTDRVITIRNGVVEKY
jgi:lipoprotein-releasing system ATP-binding protein